MRRGLRYLPVPRKGRRRVGLLGVGLLAAMSLVWQQQATLASFIDSEYAGAVFTASGELDAITPTASAGFTEVSVTWPEPENKWATPSYVLEGSTSGGPASTLYTGTARSYLQDAGATPSDRGLNFTAVAAGSTHACGVSRGTVYCWGTSTAGALGLGSGNTLARVPTSVTGGDITGRTVTAIAAGTDFTCALADGKVYCWGKGSAGQLGNGSQTAAQTLPVTVSNLTGVTSIAAGAEHACALNSAGLWCWGQGTSGQLGDGGTSQKERPTAVKTDGVLSGRTVASVAAGGAHTCAVADGQAFCWGSNASGQLGDGTTINATSRPAPVAVEMSKLLLGRTVTAIAAGTSHSCAIADGKVYCWGSSAQLGNSSVTTNSNVPVATTLSGTATKLAAGWTRSCALTGSVSCWGANYATPTAFSGTISGRTITALSVGNLFVCATGVNATAACAGDATGYKLGNNSTTATGTAFVDVTVAGPSCPDGSVRTSGPKCSLVEGTAYRYRLDYTIGTWNAKTSGWAEATTKSRGKIQPEVASATKTSITVGWGNVASPGNSYPEYQLERSTSASGTDPTTLVVTGGNSWTDTGGLAPSRSFTAVSTGDSHSCGIVGDELYCWGQNQYGQLGVNDFTARTVPTKVTGLDGKSVTAVSAGGSHTCAIADGSAYCWGSNASGQLGIGSIGGANKPSAQKVADNVTAISAGASHTCDVTGGTVYCWGLNSSGQLGVNDSTTYSTPKKVLDSSKCSGILCFIGIGTKVPVFTNGSATAVAAGGAHSCAINADAAYCWGAGGSGQLGDGDTSSSGLADKVSDGAMTNSSLSAITAGTSHTCAIRSNAAYCWGLDSSGQLGNNTSTTNQSTPVAVSGLSGVSDLSATANHTCAVALNASVKTAYCWGLAGSGQIGNSDTTNATIPKAVTALGALSGAAVTSIAAGGTHSCAVSGGLAYCWGNGADGRLGNRTTTTVNSPVKVVSDARCAVGSAALGNGLCSLVSGTNYYYRITYSLDGMSRTPGTWTALKPS